MNCPHCGTAGNPAQARFCLHCGRSLVQGIVCHTCHTLLPTHSHFCFHCGTMVIAAVSQPSYATQPVTAPTAQPAAQPQPPIPIISPQLPPLPPQLTPIPDSIQSAAPIPQPITTTTPPLPPKSPDFPPSAVPRQVAVPTESVPFSEAVVPVPSARPLDVLLPSLRLYLPTSLLEPLERRPSQRNLLEARDHLSALLQTIKTYLPRPVILTPQPAGEPAGAMRQGTFLFVDVSGFTPLSERLARYGRAGAERITGIINSLFFDLVSILFAHGGVLIKFGGDAMLGLFEADSNSEMAESGLRAVQAALAMQAIMDKFAAIEAAGETRALRIKCGISSGPYFAAHIGTRHSMAFVTTGHTVNRADQAEGNANPGDVVIAQATYDLVQGQIKVEKRSEGFYLVQEAPPAAAISSSGLADELPAGDPQAQLTYLVERMDRLSPYLAAELLPRIATNPHPGLAAAHIAPDHRPVTVMFANYVGISDLINDMGQNRPELITHHLNNYFVHMAEVVERYEGALARMDQYSVGDRLVIFFGAPRAHEDDPVRAVYTALEMQESTRRHFAALQTPDGIYRFRQRIGINTGHLFAGNVGAPNLRQEYTLMGDDINMAARLMSQAGWQEIFVSEKTRERVAPFFELADRGALKVKGKEILIPTFQVTGRRQEIGRTRGLDSGESPYTGRENEFRTAEEAGRAFLAGRSQILAVIGEGGRGKSRLKRELNRWLFDQTGNDHVLWLEGQALSFSEQVSYWLAIQLMHGALGLKLDANKDDVLFTLWERGESLLGKAVAREAIPFLAHLMELPLEGEWARWVAELEPHTRQKQTFWAIREFITALAKEQPIIIVLDDLHWADEPSLALIEDLLSLTDRVPLFFYLIFRERRDKGCWRLRDKAATGFPHRYTELHLRPLSTANSRQLLSRLLPGAKFAGPNQQEILDKAAGNPYYLEEVVRSLIASGAVVPDETQPGHWQVTDKIEQIAVPDSLEGMVVARLDRLTEEVRQALQMASVIGRLFQVGLLRKLSASENALDFSMAELERNGLIKLVEPSKDNSASSNGSAAPSNRKKRGAAVNRLLDVLSDKIVESEQEPDPTYTFPDALVQEVAYESLLVQRRREFHRRVAEELEVVFAHRLEQESELLAYHFCLSDDSEKAIHYLQLAAGKSQASFANETALRHYNRLLELFADQEEKWQERFEVLARRQKIHGLLGQQEARQQDLETMLALADAHPGPDGANRRADALNGLAELYQLTGRYAETEDTARQALSLKEEASDPAGQAAALQQMGVVAYYRGDYQQARPILEQAVSLRSQLQDAEGIGWSELYLTMIDFVQGNYGSALSHNDLALASAESRQDWRQMGIHLNNEGRILHRLGEYQQALTQLERSLEMRGRVGDRGGQGFTLFGMGLVHAYLGHYDQAEAVLRQSLELRQTIQDERGIRYCLNGLGLVALGRGNAGEAESFFQQAFDLSEQLGLKGEAINDLSFLAQARLASGNLTGAAEASQQAIARLADHKNVEDIQQIYLNHYRVLKAQNDPAACNTLQQAQEAMLSQAEQITDPSKRQGFLENVKVNQEIAAALAAEGIVSEPTQAVSQPV